MIYIELKTSALPRSKKKKGKPDFIYILYVVYEGRHHQHKTITRPCVPLYHQYQKSLYYVLYYEQAIHEGKIFRQLNQGDIKKEINAQSLQSVSNNLHDLSNLRYYQIALAPTAKVTLDPTTLLQQPLRNVRRQLATEEAEGLVARGWATIDRCRML